MKKLCIFDFDGTLFDSLTDVAKCFNETFEELGFETLDFDFYKKSLGGNVDEIISIILKDKNTPENMQLVKNTYEKIYHNDKNENTKLYEGLLDLLEELQNSGYILAINSNRTNDSIKMFLEKLANNIDFIDIQGHIPNYPSKPNPHGVNTIIKKAGVSKKEAIYIGDSITDVQTAKNAQVDCVIVEWGYGLNDVYEDDYPIAIVDNPEDILKIVKNGG